MPKAKAKRKLRVPTARRITRKSSGPTRLTGKELERAVEQFQSEPNERKAREQWKQIETSVFGVEFED